jgi:hypothetical protein
LQLTRFTKLIYRQRYQSKSDEDAGGAKWKQSGGWACLSPI